MLQESCVNIEVADFIDLANSFQAKDLRHLCLLLCRENLRTKVFLLTFGVAEFCISFNFAYHLTLHIYQSGFKELWEICQESKDEN